MARDEGKQVIPFWVRGEKWHACTPMGWYTAQYTDGRGATFTAGVSGDFTFSACHPSLLQRHSPPRSPRAPPSPPPRPPAPAPTRAAAAALPASTCPRGSPPRLPGPKPRWRPVHPPAADHHPRRPVPPRQRQGARQGRPRRRAEAAGRHPARLPDRPLPRYRRRIRLLRWRGPRRAARLGNHPDQTRPSSDHHHLV